MLKLSVIDSHTAGEPTRVVPIGAIELKGEDMVERREFFRTERDHLRRAVLCEPRGSDVLVGAVLTPPVSQGADAGVVFFNNASYLGMCGHGTIGVVETLRHLKKLKGNAVRLDTPVGSVEAEFHGPDISLRNVPARRTLRAVELDVHGFKKVLGDVAYGGNWFFIVRQPEMHLELDHAGELTAICMRIRRQLALAGITGEDGAEIDHIELSGPPSRPDADSKNFVLCPGGAYDRSPCGTGTSAKVACLVDDGELEPGHRYIQESITGSMFAAKIDRTEAGLVPTITGRAFVTAETTLIFDPEDPFRWGIG